jgi:diphosphoinositol-polyphosphate diphosphatase
MQPAREGRDLQRFDGEARLVTGCVPIYQNKIVVISSTRRDGWVLPKGGWETDETQAQAAAREAYEESGVSFLTVVVAH